MKQFFITISSIFISLASFAQPYEIQVIPTDQEPAFFNKNFNYKKNVSDSNAARLQLKELIRKVREQGYLAAAFDSIRYGDTQVKAWIKTGGIYEWVALKNGNVEEDFLSHIGYRERLYQHRPLYYKEILKLQEKLLSYAENNGYPFASVWLDSVQIYENAVSARLYMKKNQKVMIDSLVKKGEVKISNSYLENYLGIKPGELYNESTIRKISRRISGLPFLREAKPFEVAFFEDKAIIYLYLEERQANQIDLLLGLQPNTTAATGQKRLVLTGEAKFFFQNALGGGEKLNFHYRKIEPRTSRLEAGFLYPYLPFLPIGIGTDLHLEILLQDSTYINRNIEFGLLYPFRGENFIKAFIRKERTQLIEVDTARIIVTGTLPENIDSKTDLFGLAYNYENLDYRLNPRKGISFNIRGAAGVRELLKNNVITNISGPSDVDYSKIYDTLALRSFRYEAYYRLDKFWRLAARSTLRSGIAGAFKSTGAGEIYENELFRIGGNRLLRGFDEESVFASFYNLLILEYRYLLGQNSYVFLFSDGGYVQNIAPDPDKESYPLGFGTGLTFETKAGLFSVSYALGDQFDPGLKNYNLDFRSAKIHFGYVNYF